MKDLLRKSFLICLMVLVASVFVSCGGNKDATGGGDSDVKAVFVHTETDSESGVTVTITTTSVFKKDGTFTVKMNDGSQEFVVMTGTYTGDPSVDGDIEITILEEMDEESEEMKPVPEAYSKMTITITDGKCTFGSDEYTRQ